MLKQKNMEFFDFFAAGKFTYALPSRFQHPMLPVFHETTAVLALIINSTQGDYS
ncbi:MAG: hypothetical protein KKG09_08230 [Verrucomicrobia bacterium]|nr:hypothetical protein [Verrucomicrobiota bacterium]MBU4292335.1 hypothetical protein [Verrucomicrobiota bacterium]MBU4429642.1 hypothetical protein [Verrucomicrobiota bacterium]MBU4497975.1 hypothetical protein [Verrucomicrobiota bacterium]MCG2681490.1 hypothetical protein [Kiritimatiellia bacterium]